MNVHWLELGYNESHSEPKSITAKTTLKIARKSRTARKIDERFTQGPHFSVVSVKITNLLLPPHDLRLTLLLHS
jgi:hypothetical protein